MTQVVPQADAAANKVESTAAQQIEHRTIGAILVDTGRLRAKDVERVLRLQRTKGMRFGDAAVKLGLLRPADVEFAVARQFNYPYLRPGTSRVSETLTAAYRPFSTQVEALRALRSQLVVRWFNGDPARRALTILSADHEEGRSYIAANLAIVFSQLGGGTLLIDADMRAPCQHRLFGIENRYGLSTLLSGRGAGGAIHRVPGLELSVMPSGPIPPNPLELLSRPAFEQVLSELARKFAFILLDTPPAARFADAQSVALLTGASIIVVRKHATRRWRVHGVSERISQPHSTVLGTVLNDF